MQTKQLILLYFHNLPNAIDILYLTNHIIQIIKIKNRMLWKICGKLCSLLLVQLYCLVITTMEIKDVLEN